MAKVKRLDKYIESKLKSEGFDVYFVEATGDEDLGIGKYCRLYLKKDTETLTETYRMFSSGTKYYQIEVPYRIDPIDACELLHGIINMTGVTALAKKEVTHRIYIGIIREKD